MYIAMNEYDIQQTFSAAITDTQTFSAAITPRQTFYSMYSITYIVTQNDLHLYAYDSDGTSILTTKKTNKEEGQKNGGTNIRSTLQKGVKQSYTVSGYTILISRTE